VTVLLRVPVALLVSVALRVPVLVDEGVEQWGSIGQSSQSLMTLTLLAWSKSISNKLMSCFLVHSRTLVLSVTESEGAERMSTTFQQAKFEGSRFPICRTFPSKKYLSVLTKLYFFLFLASSGHCEFGESQQFSSAR